MATREDLEAQLDDDPRDAAAFLVYADFLLEHGHPHGELIRLQHALTPDSPAAAHLREFELRHKVLPVLKAHDATWELGFPRRLAMTWVHDDTLPALERTLRDPICRFIESVTLTDYVQARGLIDLLVGLPRLREVALRCSLELINERSALALLEGVGRLQRLERLTLHARQPMEHLHRLPAFEHLERLTLVGAHLDEADAGALRTARARVSKRCTLHLVQCGLSLAAEDVLGAAWPFELDAHDRPGLIVDSPATHYGRWVLMAETRRVIGEQITCDLMVPAEHVAFVDRTVRHFGGQGQRLQEGDRVELGDDVVLRFTEDVERSRAVMRRVPRTIKLTDGS